MEQKGSNNERRVDDNHHQTGGDQQQQQQQAAAMMMFDELRQEIGKIDVYAETIELTYHLRKFGELFRRRITTEQQLNDLFLHLNEAALADSGFAIQFALVFASRQLGDVPIGGTNVRNAMITTLQHNFLAIERLKQEGGERFHNSIILLGEYYHRKMVGHGCRIKILGQSLLLLLTSELEQEINRICQQPASAHRLDPKFAKVLLQQITLNGTVWKEVHQKEANDLLYTMRKALIVIPNLCAPAKAFLLMALDLYSGSLGNELLDKLYGKYLTEPSKEAEQAAVNGGTSNGPTDPPSSAHNQSAINGEKSVEKQAKKDSQKDTAVQQKPKGSKSNAPSGRSTGGGKATNQNLTTNDKENKRRTTQTTKAAPAAQKTSPKASTGRSIRVHEDGNIVATIVTRDAPTTPTKKHLPAAATQPAPVPNAASPRSPTKKGLSPRMEKLAALPKITITCATPSPKRTQDKPPSAVSPRAVLGPSIGKQKPHQPPKSPTHSREGQQYGVRNVSEASRGRQDRARGAAATGKEATVRVVEAISPVGVNPPNETRSQHETRVEEPQPIVLPESPKRYDWSDPTPVDPTQSWSYVPPPPSRPEQPSKTVECATTEPARHDLTPSDEPGTKKTDDSTGAGDVSKPKHKVKPSYLREENVENLSWDVLIPLEDESPQKVNPHTKSFLSFLASE